MSWVSRLGWYVGGILSYHGANKVFITYTHGTHGSQAWCHTPNMFTDVVQYRFTPLSPAHRQLQEFRQFEEGTWVETPDTLTWRRRTPLFLEKPAWLFTIQNNGRWKHRKLPRDEFEAVTERPPTSE